MRPPLVEHSKILKNKPVQHGVRNSGESYSFQIRLFVSQAKSSSEYRYPNGASKSGFTYHGRAVAPTHQLHSVLGASGHAGLQLALYCPV